jgi:hypothetical protein
MGIRTSDLRFIRRGPSRLSYLLGTRLGLWMMVCGPYKCYMLWEVVFYFENDALSHHIPNVAH